MLKHKLGARRYDDDGQGGRIWAAPPFHSYVRTHEKPVLAKNERCGREGREAKGDHLIFVLGGGGEEGSGAEYFRADCQLFIWLAEGCSERL